MPAVTSTALTLRILVATAALLAGAVRGVAEEPTGMGAAGAASSEEARNLEFFERSVRPLLSQHCYSCHAKGQAKGGLSLADRKGLLAGGEGGAVVSLGKPGESPLIAAIEGRDGLQMPPNSKLSENEVAALKRWVELGAPWPESKEGTAASRAAGGVTAEDRAFWAFQPVRSPVRPRVADPGWVRRPLDEFVLAGLEQQGLRPVPEADRRTFLRRATFDLTGLLPQPGEVAEFVADERPDAYERLIDRLLASPQYGERWARSWLDVARYGEDQAHTFQARLYPNGFRYRDWVVEAFNRDLPYDRFVMEQIAGDLLPEAAEDRERAAALGYLALGPVYYKDAGCAGKAESDEIDDRIDTLCRGFLGLTVSCARCHDHKFDPISTKDYYGLAGVFASTEYREVPLVPDEVVREYDRKAQEIKDREKAVTDGRTQAIKDLGEQFARETAKSLVAVWRLTAMGQTPTGEEWDQAANETKVPRVILERWGEFLKSDVAKQRSYLKELHAAVTAAAMSEPRDPSPEEVAAVEQASQRVQEPLLAAIEARRQSMEPAAKDGATGDAQKDKPKLEPAQTEILKDLLTDKSAPLALPKDRAEKLFSEETKGKLAALQKEVEQAKGGLGPKYPFAHGLADGTPKNLKVHVRGNHKELGEEAPRQFLAILSPENAAPFQQGSGRLELAQAIANPANPLTARVLVNRVWLNHFGRGLVGTPSNFGLLGERPTHPELLDHLAERFIASGWSIKALHREIMLSATYRLGSDPRRGDAARELAADPDNRLLWRQNRRRLEIEAWRDAMLQASDRLDDRLGGAAISLGDAGNRRRTLYAAISRHDLNGTLRLFDFPDPNLTSERRVTTTVPMQQLFVLNSEFLTQQAKALSRRVQEEARSADDASRIEQVYAILFQRKPTDTERQIGLAYLLDTPLPDSIPAAEVKLSAWERYAQVLLGTNEFAFLD